MKYSWCEIKKLVSCIHHSISFLWNQFILIFPRKVFIPNIEVFFLSRTSHTFAYAKNHMQNKIPIIMSKKNKAFWILFVKFMDFWFRQKRLVYKIFIITFFWLLITSNNFLICINQRSNNICRKFIIFLNFKIISCGMSKLSENIKSSFKR